ncbi:MAG: type II secretion system F family protein [Phycisphaerales bacterium]
MPTFAYRTLAPTGGGGALSATIDAPDRASAVRELVRRGVTPSTIEPLELNGAADPPARGDHAAHPAGAAARARATGFLSRPAMSRSEMASFVRELATALQAGLPLVPALRTIARQGRNENQKRMLATLVSDVEHGKSLADAAAAWGRPFSELMINLLRAGEASGRLPEVLTQAANLLDRDVKLRRSILAATLYPMILGGLLVIAVIVIVTFIVPRILEPIQKSGKPLPVPTQIVQGAAAFFGGYWWAIIPAVALAFIAGSRVYARPAARLEIDRALLSAPLLGRLLRDVAVARFTRTLGTLTAAGIPVLQALKITKGTLSNRAMEGVIDDVCDQVAAGKTIADPMEASGYFPPMLVQIVNLGERSGRLDEMLGQAAGAFEERTETSVKLFTTALPPVLVVILACVVGFIVLAILLPLLQLQESLS